MTTTNIRRWGNSQGLYIPKSMLKQLGIALNSPVTLALENDAIIIRKYDAPAVRADALASLRMIREKAQSSNKRGTGERTDYREEYEEYLDEKYGD